MPSGSMERYWNGRAREDPFRYVDNRRWRWQDDMESFWRGGQEALNDLLTTLGMRLNGSEDVVEIGCGVGRVTRSLAERAGSVHALDVSGEMLARARQLNPGLDHVRWLHGDGRSLAPLPDRQFDVCISLVVFQHLPDPELTYAYVREMGRVLRPDGWAAVQVSNDPDVHRRPRLLRRTWRQLTRRRYEHSAWYGSAIEIPRLRQTAAGAGLELERVENEGSQFCHVLLRARG